MVTFGGVRDPLKEESIFLLRYLPSCAAASKVLEVLEGRPYQCFVPSSVQLPEGSPRLPAHVAQRLFVALGMVWARDLRSCHITEKKINKN